MGRRRRPERDILAGALSASQLLGLLGGVVVLELVGVQWFLLHLMRQNGRLLVHVETLEVKPSHAWWHRVGEIGSPWEEALAASEALEDEHHPGDWEKVVRSFRDGHQESWWALEMDLEPYGPQRSRRAVVATTDPEELPDKAT
jgi:hypothetical protein